jgi:single-strand DNA-binding protein
MLNMVIAIGKLAKPLQLRSLPSGISLASFDVVVPRPDQSADSIPVALFEAPDGVSNWETGQELLVIGRVRRRFFRIGGSTQSRTEVVAQVVVPLAQTDRVRSALVEAGTALAGVLLDLHLG